MDSCNGVCRFRKDCILSSKTSQLIFNNILNRSILVMYTMLLKYINTKFYFFKKICGIVFLTFYCE